MKVRTIEVLNEKFYYEKLDNGLKVYLFPNANESNYEINLMTPFGSTTKSFKKAGTKFYLHVPQGTAHFLEHQLFETEMGMNLTEKFDSLSLYSNATTAPYYTEYYVRGMRSFKKALNILLDQIQTPVLKDTGTEKERGIIIEERRQKDNNPYINLHFSELEMVYHQDNIRYSGLGSIEEIKGITTQHLFDFYEHFYHPSKMYLIISGKFSHKEAIDIIKENQIKKFFSSTFDIQLTPNKEPEEVKEQLKEISLPFEKSQFLLTYKIDKSIFNDLPESIAEIEDYLYYVLENNFGSTADFSDYLLKSGLTSERISAYISIHDKYILIRLIVATEKHEKLRRVLQDKMHNLDIDEKSFNRYKKNVISDFLYESQSASFYIKVLRHYIIYNLDFPDDYLNVVKKMNYNKLEKIIKLLNLKHNSTLFVYPNNSKD